MTNKEREQRIDKLSDLFGFELPIDKWISSFLNRPSINVPATARFFGQKDPEYNDRSYVYRGEPNVPLSNYIEKKYGKDVANEFNLIM
jgi:hypothetical protein